MSYKTIKGLKSNDMFSPSVEKLYRLASTVRGTYPALTSQEEVFLLSSALILLRAYELDKSYRSYAEFGYDLILKYSLVTKNFDPLYDFSVNFGFYPTAKLLVEMDMIQLDSLKDELAEIYIEDKYGIGELTETYDQRSMRDVLSSETRINEICLVAPTSYGKSSLVEADIRLNLQRHKKVALIVPTKSLISQNYTSLKKVFPGMKIILHDEMYMGEDQFIGILTQERAIRLLTKNPELKFDKLYIDEAHNLFSDDHRVIMLARLIKTSKRKNEACHIVYLSPLIANSDNLRYSNDQDIVEQRIDFNMKEPTYYNYSLDGSLTMYNRFLDDFYELGKSGSDYLKYVSENSDTKNFIYIYSPRQIEEFAREFILTLPTTKDPFVDEIVKNLSEHVHEDFFIIECLQRGVVYLHGRLPDNVKEYLEHKFKELDSLRYLIANSVVLEGVNLPINRLFIFSTYRLHAKELTNLIGRVNRLNDIFLNQKDVNLLSPAIHFMNTEKYSRKDSNMARKIRLLRTGITEDEIENPLLYEFDISKFDPEKPRDKTRIDTAERIQSEENVLEKEHDDPIQALKKTLIQAGLGSIFNISDHLAEIIHARIDRLDYSEDLSIVELIYKIFVHDMGEHIHDMDFARLEREETRNYYSRFIVDYRSKPLKQSINKTVAGFKKRVADSDKQNVIFVGERLGEIANPNGGHKLLYIDLGPKTTKQMVNIAIGKLKIENDFIQYKFSMILQVVLDYDIINIETYNLIIYGTNDLNKLQLMRLGIGAGILAKLENDEQLQNIYVDANNVIKTRGEFSNYLESLDDFTRFEIQKYL